MAEDLPDCNYAARRNRNYTNGGVLVVQCRDCGDIKGYVCPACEAELDQTNHGFKCVSCGIDYHWKG